MKTKVSGVDEYWRLVVGIEGEIWERWRNLKSFLFNFQKVLKFLTSNFRIHKKNSFSPKIGLGKIPPIGI
jgi:hypothetical protein